MSKLEEQVLRSDWVVHNIAVSIRSVSYSWAMHLPPCPAELCIVLVSSISDDGDSNVRPLKNTSSCRQLQTAWL